MLLLRTWHHLFLVLQAFLLLSFLHSMQTNQPYATKCSLAGSTLPVVTGLIFKCKNESKNSPETIQLDALDSSHDGRKASLNWIVAMQKVEKTGSTNLMHICCRRWWNQGNMCLISPSLYPKPPPTPCYPNWSKSYEHLLT